MKRVSWSALNQNRLSLKPYDISGINVSCKSCIYRKKVDDSSDDELINLSPSGAMQCGGTVVKNKHMELKRVFVNGPFLIKSGFL